ncbi:hypothetical protein GYMLUDRAFT_705185 [Collybiopsis luxurians FD-317 M1]|uniref:MFS general substrate transporter n=1 Tax=Collybiopsis luxurians FD-317 M1 TaxID=944289 RepID=A0A0D0B481_9AGAR|nr:hypothetical protein GYMLUDRAFT_705185 [Collybiopsis luxurians FD-317 M1]
MTGGGFAVIDGGPHVNDASRFSGVSYVRGPSWLHMPALTVGLFGISILWSVEMAYASPYLISLGLSKSSMAVVFVAGPLSGLVMQPLIGILADSNTSRWGRRRPYMIVGTILCVFAIMLLGWTKEVAGIFTSRLGFTLWLAVLSVFLIDFSVNAVMAVDRALLVDILPSTLQPAGNAWAARMGVFGNVVGYFAGNLDLPSILPIFGHTELQILSVVTSLILLGSHTVMAASVQERVLLKSTASGAGGPLAKSFTAEVKAMFENMWSLPRVIRQIFLIQFFAWIAWFPILFYSTLYIGDLYKQAFFASAIIIPPSDISEDTLAKLDSDATRIGSRALFYSSLLAFFMNVFLPFFVAESSPSSLRRKQERQHSGHTIPTGPWWRNLAIPEMLKVHLVSLWAVSQGVLAAAMLATFFTSSVAGASILITISGFSLAIAQWAPFALLGEAILTEPASGGSDEAGGIRLVDTRSRLSMHRRRSSESRRELALLSRGSRDHYDSDQENRHRPNADENTFVPGDASDSDDDSAESDDEVRARKERDARRKALLGLGEAVVSSPNVTPVVPQYLDQEEEEEDEEVDEDAVLVGRSRRGRDRDEEEGGGDSDEEIDEHDGGGLSAKAGIILGIHNIFIVIPQFLVTGMSSVIFALFDPGKSALHGHPGGTLGPAHNATAPALMMRDDEDTIEMIKELQDAAASSPVVYIFRIGGVSALIAFVLCWRLARELRHR